MSIPKKRHPLPPAEPAADQPPSRRRGHYFDPSPSVASRPHTVPLRLGELHLDLQADRGVFGSKRIDLGTLVLLREAPPPPASGDVLDLGTGYGPIAIAMARSAPATRFWAVDVNERALELTRANAASAGTANVTACLPAEIPAGLRFDAIYSNPPVRIGKRGLHALLEEWLARLAPEGRAYLVVQRNLGSDSLATWLAGEGYPVQRLKSKKGYRILGVGRKQAG
jgi:16S rRNA (guanine1207-N2)-methyltransferase